MEQLSERMNDQVIDQVSDGSIERMIKWASDQVSERSIERASSSYWLIQWQTDTQIDTCSSLAVQSPFRPSLTVHLWMAFSYSAVTYEWHSQLQCWHLWMTFSTAVLPSMSDFLNYSNTTIELLYPTVWPPMNDILNYSGAIYKWLSQLQCCHLWMTLNYSTSNYECTLLSCSSPKF
jgi:hypothetical protein